MTKRPRRDELDPTRVLPQDVAKRVTEYVPRIVPSRDWDLIRAIFITACCMAGAQTVRTMENVLAILARHLHGRYLDGVPLTLDALFHPEAVETQIAMWKKEVTAPGSELTVTSARRWASELRTVAPRIAPTVWPADRERIPDRPGVMPGYTDPELLQLLTAIHAFPDPGPRLSLTRATDLILGVGATPPEARAALGTDVHRDGDGIVYVRFTGPDGDDVYVPAAAPYADRIWTAALDAGTGPLLPITAGKNALAVLLRTPLGSDVPALKSSRLRSTWLADRLRAGVPLNALTRYARLTSGFWVRDIIPSLPEPDPVTTVDAMRRDPRDTGTEAAA